MEMSGATRPQSRQSKPVAMKILIIERDTMFSNLLASKMRTLGHDVIETTIKNEGIEQIDTNKVDAVYFDPAPMNEPKSILLQIRRMVHTYPYLVLLGENVDSAAAIKAGCHDGLAKPLDPAALSLTLENAERMVSLVAQLGDDSYDFPSAGGVISKSAFNQLFLSAMDRVSRYGESTKILFISIPNYEDIKLDDGKYAADFAASKLAQNLVRLRRQSDILAQTHVNEYALLLQRPQGESESVDAAKRFSAALDDQEEVTSNGVTDLYIDVSLIDLPSGAREFRRTSRIKGQGVRNAG